MPSGEPPCHLQQEPPRREQQRRRQLDPGGQLQASAERLRQLDPLVRFRQQPVGLVERGEEFLVEAPAEAAAGKRAHLTEGLAPKPQQRLPMAANRLEDRDRQLVEQRFERLGEPVRLSGAGQGNGAQTGGGPAQLQDAQLAGLPAHALHQPALAAEETHARFDLHHDGGKRGRGIDHGDARRELKAPGRNPAERRPAPVVVDRARGAVSARRRRARQEGRPEHGTSPAGPALAPAPVRGSRSVRSDARAAASGSPRGLRAPKAAR